MRLFLLFTILRNLHFERGIFVLFLIEHGLSGVQIGTLQTILFWSNLLSEIPTGWIADRWGRKATLAVAQLLLFVNGLGFVLTDGMLPFALLFAIQGIAFSCASGADDAFLFGLVKKDSGLNSARFDHVLGRVRKYGSAALGVSIIVGGLLAEHSWDLAFLCYAGGMLLSAFVLSFLPREDAEAAESLQPETHGNSEERESWGVVLDMLRARRSVWLFLIPVLLFEAFYTPFYIFSQARFHSDQWSVTTTALAVGSTQILGSFAFTLIPKLSQRFSLLQLGVGTSLLAAAFAAGGHFLGPIAAMAAFVAVDFVGKPFFAMYDAWYQQRFPANQMATALSIKSAATSVAISFGYIAVGWGADLYGIEVALFALTSLAVLSAVLMLITRPPEETTG